jgi:hypothetical protein
LCSESRIDFGEPPWRAPVKEPFDREHNVRRVCGNLDQASVTIGPHDIRNRGGDDG